LAVVLARRLQCGDPGGDLRRAIKHFPFPQVGERIVKEYFIENGKAPDEKFKTMPMPTLRPRPSLVELTVVANFVEVFLAKEGHEGKVGINFLEKIQLPTLPSLYGAMLAGVDYVLMGAGIPRAIPGLLDKFALGEDCALRIDVSGAAPGQEFHSTFSPREFCGGEPQRLNRPAFLGIIASATLAMTLAKKSSGRVDGFIIEGPTAGGHNAPPRGAMQLTPGGEPLYGPRDEPDLDKIRALGLPFWMAGSYGRPGKLAEALALGAAGIQVGTAFAFCQESGIEPGLKRRTLDLIRSGNVRVFTDPLASPTGFPFKMAQVPGTLSEVDLYLKRTRVCDLGYLRELYLKDDGTVGYRCPAEPEAHFTLKGGAIERTVGRKCICNGLPATVGLAQIRAEGESELPVATAGDDLVIIGTFLPPGRENYTAVEVIERLLADT
jgi:nitronate monooxygenase